VLIDGEAAILDLQLAHVRKRGAFNSAFSSMQALIESGQASLDLAASLVAGHDPLDRVSKRPEGQLLAPLPTPIQIRDCLGFEQHLINTANTVKRRLGATDFTPRHKTMFELVRTRPFWYKCNRFAVAGPDITVVWPPYSQIMDYEHEMAAVLGRGGRDIPADKARSHIFGYMIFNDFSARDTQGPEMDMFGPCKSKDFDNANIFGPCIVTADEFDPYSAVMISRVNGVAANTGNSSSMNYKFEDLIAYISQHETLHAGEVICSGTIGGGSGLDLGIFLNSGDVVELEIAGIGVLRNKVVYAKSANA
jgi:2-keto-4-pentenoate hydratase/2-oxohepta-3-ene-1,7-dioic acid hydratase in catechol pathway